MKKVTYSLRQEIYHYFLLYDKIETYNHSIMVGDFAYTLAKKVGVNPNQAQIAGFLHDISAIYPNNERVGVAEKMGLPLLKEEYEFPMIIHQKISRYIAKNEFEISDSSILSAIECHTTLKKNYSSMDLVVFVADKIMWDQSGEPPYLSGLLTALDHSLEHAAFYYIDYLLHHNIKIIHPWLLDAYQALLLKIDKKEDW